jgi:predicted DNA-binding transcriptional regulator AlpA
MTTQTKTVVRRTQLPSITGLSMATIDRARVLGDFPKPFRLGVQAIGFWKSDIDDWLASRPLCSHFAESL